MSINNIVFEGEIGDNLKADLTERLQSEFSGYANEINLQNGSIVITGADNRSKIDISFKNMTEDLQLRLGEKLKSWWL